VGAHAQCDAGELRRGDRRLASGPELGPVGFREVEPADVGVSGCVHTPDTWWCTAAGLGRRSRRRARRARRAIVGFAVPRRASASTRAATGASLGRGGARRPACSRRSRAEPRACMEPAGRTGGIWDARGPACGSGPCLVTAGACGARACRTRA
jgi:hypothetical protein